MSSGAVLVFSVDNAESFQGAKSWVKELQRRGDPNVVIALAGNKIDLESRAVSKEEALAFAEENGIIYMETSAKTGHNVRELFVAIARRLPKSSLSAGGDGVTNQGGGVAVTLKDTSSANAGPSCC